MKTIKCRFCGWSSPAFRMRRGKHVHQFAKLVEHVSYRHEAEYERLREELNLLLFLEKRGG